MASSVRTQRVELIAAFGRKRRPLNAQSLVNLLMYIIMSIVAIAFLLPLIWMLSASLKSESDVLTVPPSFIPASPQWGNYAAVFKIIPLYLFNSAKLALLNVGGVLIIASLAGYGFARLRFAGSKILFMLLLSTSIIPGIIYLIPQYIVFLKLGWIDTHYPLWVPRVLTPVFATFLMRQAFSTLPQDLEDAARIDGAATFRIFSRIMLPQVKPALAAVSMFTFLDSWNDLFGPLIFLNSPDLQTLPVAMALFQGEFFTNVSLLMGAATVAIVPVLIVYLIVQKYFIEGIATTGIG